MSLGTIVHIEKSKRSWYTSISGDSITRPSKPYQTAENGHVPPITKQESYRHCDSVTVAKGCHDRNRDKKTVWRFPSQYVCYVTVHIDRPGCPLQRHSTGNTKSMASVHFASETLLILTWFKISRLETECNRPYRPPLAPLAPMLCCCCSM